MRVMSYFVFILVKAYAKLLMFAVANYGLKTEPLQHSKFINSASPAASTWRIFSAERRDLSLQRTVRYIIYHIFITARFYIVHSNAPKIPVPKIHLLVYAITTCGRPRNLARRLQTVLESGVGGAYSSSVQTHEPLPAEF